MNGQHNKKEGILFRHLHLISSVYRTLLHQSIENNNVELKNEAKCI